MDKEIIFGLNEEDMMINKSGRSLGQVVREDRLTEYSRERLNEMARLISESRDPDVIARSWRCELHNIVHDYDVCLVAGQEGQNYAGLLNNPKGK